MATHFEQLAKHVPNLASARILDVGSGRGGFLVDAARHGATAQGVEYNPEYITETLARAQEAGVHVEVKLGAGESLPFPDGSFNFVNLSEVIEHVKDPDLVLSEVYRILAPHGSAYISVPNRFGLKDQHFHLYGVNWLPRAFADSFISIFGTHKNYTDTSAGVQRLADMHYNTYGGARRLMERHGFSVRDIRAEKIKERFSALIAPIVLIVYRAMRFAYFDSFHLIVTRPN